jgi:hypothetical protein
MLLHGLVPLYVAHVVWPAAWRRAFVVMIATMAVDVDHLLATPMLDPQRCSIAFHPLHSHLACVVYGVLTLFPRTRMVGLGLSIHMLLDGVDCAWMRVAA